MVPSCKRPTFRGRQASPPDSQLSGLRRSVISCTRTRCSRSGEEEREPVLRLAANFALQTCCLGTATNLKSKSMTASRCNASWCPAASPATCRWAIRVFSDRLGKLSTPPANRGGRRISKGFVVRHTDLTDVLDPQPGSPLPAGVACHGVPTGMPRTAAAFTFAAHPGWLRFFAALAAGRPSDPTVQV